MLKFLTILRTLLYPLIEGAGEKSISPVFFLWKKYWAFFWDVEEKLERLEIGERGDIISGSERATLIEKVLEGEKKPKILEIGVGYGQNLAILSALVPSTKFSAIDLDSNRIAATENFFQLNKVLGITLQTADARNLPFKDASFDVSFSSAVLLYLNREGVKEALSELIRVTKNKIILLEQHQEGIEETKLAGGLTESFYYLRDYEKLILEIDPDLKYEKLRIMNPRWGGESWKEAAHIFKIILK